MLSLKTLIDAPKGLMILAAAIPMASLQDAVTSAKREPVPIAGANAVACGLDYELRMGVDARSRHIQGNLDQSKAYEASGGRQGILGQNVVVTRPHR